jgi:hypothetical protein
MVTFLITSFLLLTAVIFVLYRWQRSASDEQTEYTLPPAPRLRGLFGEDSVSHGRRRLSGESLTVGRASTEQRESLLARAAEGEKAALLDVDASVDADLYEEVLNALVQRAIQTDASGKGLLALASYITRQEGLRINAPFAEAIIESWKLAPDRGGTAKMLHLVARSDDARIYQRAVELAFQSWLDGRVQDLTATELRTLADGEYWTLSQPVRSSGAGFVLKRKLAEVRRELEEAATHAG